MADFSAWCFYMPITVRGTAATAIEVHADADNNLIIGGGGAGGLDIEDYKISGEGNKWL